MNFDLKTVMAHKPPMLLADFLTEAGAQCAVTAFTVKEDNIFLDENGVLSREALVEIMAQALAGFNAYKSHIQNIEGEKGFLVGLKNVRVHADAHAGDMLKSEIKITDFIAGTFIALGRVTRGSSVLCEGELRIFTFK